ncbi:MAG: T9SS type A sorting domain-containing protein [Sphingobacteriaceae bacterium]|nr:T9SS type A sorting domain-containing protein [Sphingobacteriaceae bacterium]
MRLKIYILLLSCQLSVLFAQNTTARWYFGAQAGLDFMGPPTIMTNGMMSPWEGCASIANGAGALLFYTDGITVWNQTHAVMANGTGLFGNSSSTQSGVIVKQPGNTNIYYIFTVAAQGAANGLRYSIVDMNLAGGNGSVTVKNALIFTPSTEKITAVRHCNGLDVWVVTHDWLSANFRSLLLTSAGITSTVVTTLGPVHSTNTGNTIGQMKASPNGRKLCLGMQYAPFDTFHLCDFDNNTGVVSNLIDLGTGLYVWAYGVEFSPDGTKLYGGKYGGGVTSITQWNVCAGSSAAIIGSAFTVATGLPNQVFSFQTGPNGKIYVARISTQQLGVINNPNVAGAGCNYVNLGQSTAPRNINLGLPNFVTSYLKAPPAPYTYTTNPALVTCLTASFFAPPGPTVNCSSSNYSITGYNWDFGDPPSGPSNTSTATNPTHTYPGPGTYSVTLITNFTCGADTVIIPVVVNPCNLLPVELTSFRSVCLNKSIELNWETASEKNNSEFILKRSVDGMEFKNIARIFGSGNSSTPAKYSIIDNDVQVGRQYYYRLMQMDYDKTERLLHNEVFVKCNEEPADAEIFPIPTRNELFISSNKNLKNVEISILNNLGQKIKSVHIDYLEQYKDLEIESDDIQNGCYLVIISAFDKQIQKKIIINR